jgi:hypothetical protein
MRPVRRAIIVSLFALGMGLAGCAGLRPVPENIADYSSNYSAVMERFADQEIVLNILRARDGRPLHFSELSQVTGSLQTQLSASVSAPFGRYLSDAKTADSGVLGYQFQSNPTFQTSPLDTEAFQIGMLQPVQAGYVTALWNPAEAAGSPASSTEISNANLMNLFVQRVRVPRCLAQADLAELGCSSGNYVWIDNGDSAEWAQFLGHVTNGELRLATVNLLWQVGEPFEIRAGGPAPGAKSNAATVTPDKVKDMADEVNFHLGMVPGAAGPRQYALYRRWGQLPALCVAPRSKASAAGQAGERSSRAYGLTSALAELTQRGVTLVADHASPQAPPISASFAAATSFATFIDDFVACDTGLVTVSLDEEVDTARDGAAQPPASVIQFRSVSQVFEALGREQRKADDHLPSYFALGRLQQSNAAVGAVIAGPDDFFYGADLPKRGSPTPLQSNSARILVILHQLVNSKKFAGDIPTTKQVLVVP